MKTCATCKIEKSLENFAKNKTKPDGLHNQCRSCKNLYNRSYYAKDRTAQYERVKARAVVYKALAKDYVWNLIGYGQVNAQVS